MHSGIKIKKFKITFIAFLIMMSLSAEVFAAQDKIVAIINAEAITQVDLDEYLKVLYFQLSTAYEGDALKSKIQEAGDGALDMLIENKLIIQQAKKQEMVADEYRLEKELEDIKARFGSEREFEEGLISKGLSLADIKRKIADKILMRDIIEREIRSKVFVHPQEVTDYYQSHLEDFQLPDQVDTDSIFIPFADSESKAKEKAYEILAVLKRGKDFNRLRQQYSKAESLGLLTRGHLIEEIEDVVFDLEVDAISLPIRTDKGFFILKIKNKIPAHAKELSKVQDVIYGFLFQKKFEERFVEWIDEIKNESFIIIK